MGVMGIYTVGEKKEEPEDVGILIESTRVLNNNGSVILALITLFGLIYALDLSYPDKLKSTFEFIQKVVMNLDPQKLSPKVEQLKIKLFA